MRSTSAKLLAVRRVTQDNQGKKTPGVDGIAHFDPAERCWLVQELNLGRQARPVRRVGIPKPGTQEKRPRGIPTRSDRAAQQGRCAYGKRLFLPGDDLIERHHKDGDRTNNKGSNFELLHRHCHDAVHRQQRPAANP